MTVPDAHKRPESMLQKESRILREQLTRLGDCFLNKTFDLSFKGSQRRLRALIIVFLLAGAMFSLRVHPLAIWGEELRLFFRFMLNPVFMQANPGLLTRFFSFSFGSILAPQTLRFLPLFILPFVVALQSTATYLADIFELKKIEIAREFIQQVALTGNRKSITIGNGEVKDKDSPIYQIGGPGQVLVELDTAALFVKANGQPHVIGPTIKGKVKLEGFERFRQALDLRDQYTDALEVRSRSLDGIPVGTTDVRMVFSVWRGDKEPSAETPHPFDEKAIETLVFSQASRVVLDGPFPSEPPTSWTGTIQGLIRGRLGGFMSQHRLAEYLASIGAPEVEQARKREEEIVKVGQEVISKDDSLEPRNIPPAPDFQARHVVSNLFGEFAKDFTKNANSRGVQLGWIGIGTWKTPNEIVPSKHLEAWRLSQENMGRGSEGALESLRQEAQLQQILRLIKNTPLARFHQNTGNAHKDTIQDLLVGYREQMIETIVLLTKSNQQIPKAIPAAVKHIEGILGIKHWVGGTGATSGIGAPRTSPKSGHSRSKSESGTGVPSLPPISAVEEDLYQDLYSKTGLDEERIERLINHERKSAPNASRAELLQRAIDRWLIDNR